MEEPAAKEAMKVVGGINLLGEDVLQEILSRLPASTFASATCVNRSWSHLCNRILTKPKLVSALSLNPNLQVAVSEVVEKVLEQPIRPHFAIASIGRNFSLPATGKLITSRLGDGIPIIVSEAYGIIGKDVLTDHIKEVNWLETDDDEMENFHRGIVLTIGFLPGLKVFPIPLMKTIEGPSQQSTIDKFVTDIKDYTASVSDRNSPLGIILFADRNADMRPVLEKMDCAMSRETIIVGDESGCFLWNDGEGFKEDAIALVFAPDRDKPQGIGEVHFSLALSTGVSPVGPVYKAASVRVVKDDEGKCYTWLTARREGSLEKLDGEVILEEIDDMMSHASDNDLYIGVTKRRKCSVGSERKKLVSTLAFHEVSRGDEDYLYVVGDGIKTGDTFQFFCPYPEGALMSRNVVFDNLRALKERNGDKKVMCGGLIFSCCGRGESFLEQRNIDSSAFSENFEGVSLSGMFCCGEIGRSSVTIGEDNDEQISSNCVLHVYSSVYLLIMHTP